MESLVSIAVVVLLIILGFVSLDIMGFFSWGNKFPVEGRTVLLTGASYGMGKEVAKLLAERGANVILVARTVEKLQSAMEYAQLAAKNPSSQRFHIISADLTVEAENARMFAEATRWNNGVAPEIVWANAGSSTPGLFLEYKTETLRQQMDMNYWAAAYLAQQTLKAWLYPDTPYKPLQDGAKSEPSRHFIVTSSVLAVWNIAGYAAYSPAKAALKSLCDGLRNEVNLYNGARRSKTNPTGQTPAPFDVVIQAILPATIASPGHTREQQTKHAVTKILEEADGEPQTELEAAVAAMKGLEAGNYMTATNWLGDLIRLSGMGSSPRDGILKDTFGMSLSSLVALFLIPDLEGKVWNWGKKEGMIKPRPNAL